MPEAIGVDLGGTKTAAGLVDEHGRILRRAEAPSVHGRPDVALATIVDLVRLLRSPEAVGVGLGAAGLVDFERGHYLYGPNTGLQDLPLREMLARSTGIDVRLDNDANCATWAEHHFGSGRGTRHFLCVTLGTGIGAGLVLDGHPYRGARGGAGEFGHLLVERDGHPCGCGRRGCWEQYASGRALERIARRRLGEAPAGLLGELAGGTLEGLDGPAVTAAARAGDALALEVVDEVATWLGLGLGSLVNALEPDRIAIAGGLGAEWDLLAPRALESARGQMEAPEHRPAPEIVAAELGADAGIVGAAWLVLAP